MQEHNHEFKEVSIEKTNGLFSGDKLILKGWLCECGYYIGFELKTEGWGTKIAPSVGNIK